MKSDQGFVPETATTTGADMGGRVKRNCSKSITERKVKRKKTERDLWPVSLILQDLYASCNTVFQGPGVSPSPSHVQSLSSILDRMEPEDLGLRKNLQFFNPGNAVNENRQVTYTNIYKCDKFSFVLFFIPASGVIPLHNHPGMTVFSKLLFGQIHHKSYDWVDPDDSKRPSGLRLARLKADVDLSAPCTRVLYPTSGGNIHEFQAITPCVMLDVIGPPYSKDEDRDCTYYKDLPFDVNNQGSEFVGGVRDDEKYGWLEEIEMPKDSRMDWMPYLGPRVVEKLP